MQTLETFIHYYGISHGELSQLLGKHKSHITRVLHCHRPGRRYVEALFGMAGQHMEKIPDAECVPAQFCSPAPEWLAQECLKAETIQLRLTEWLNLLEKQQRQVRFWYYVSRCACDFHCGDAWAKRHYEEKLYKLRRTWETHYLPLLMRLRETEARIALLKGLPSPLSLADMLHTV